MRILIYPHDLGMGGSQMNAIDLARGLVDRGHEVCIYGRPGVLLERIEQLGLEFIAAPEPRHRPSDEVITDLIRLVKQRRLDVLHGYEWPPGLECHLAARRSGALAITTVMSMAVAPFLPRSMPLVVGTEQIAALERRQGRRLVHVLEPPVDTSENAPGLDLDLTGFRSRWLPGERPTMVCVTRFARELKLEGLLTAMDAVGRLAAQQVPLGEAPIRLLVVGDGVARPEVEEQARLVNAAAGPGTVVLTGTLADPRPAYAVADIALGMGGSALRAMAFAKPLVVQGEQGFFRLLDRESVPDFLWTGWYGVGGPHDPAAPLAASLHELLHDPQRRSDLGALSRDLVVRRFSLEESTSRLEGILRRGLTARRSNRLVAMGADVAAAARFTRYYLAKRARRALGTGATDDFNSRPVASTSVARPRQLPAAADGTTSRLDPQAWLWFPGVSYDGVTGTDKQLVRALSTLRPVVWVDPPMSWRDPRRPGWQERGATLLPDGIIRVRTISPPGVTRPLLREVARWLTQRNARRALRASGYGLEAVLVSTPEQHLPSWTGSATRLYFETDDFVAGASLLGHSVRHMVRNRARNLAHSHGVLGVTEEILTSMRAGSKGHVLPNGCDAASFDPDCSESSPTSIEVSLPQPVVGVVGQLNERLDLSLLEAVADAGISLLLVGPRYEQDGLVRARIDQLIARTNVQWIDRRPYAEIPALMGQLTVGLTPYTRSDFNLGSFPLKTLDYLAAGLPVVSTDLPSARTLDAPDLLLAVGAEEFVAATRNHLEGDRLNEDAAGERRRFAARHSWAARAQALVEIAAQVRGDSPCSPLHSFRTGSAAPPAQIRDSPLRMDGG